MQMYCYFTFNHLALDLMCILLFSGDGLLSACCMSNASSCASQLILHNSAPLQLILTISALPQLILPELEEIGHPSKSLATGIVGKRLRVSHSFCME